MIYEIQTIRRIRANLEYLFIVNTFVPQKVTTYAEKKIDRRQVDNLIRGGGFQKVEILSPSGNYSVFQKHTETPELWDISERMTKEMIKDKTLFIIKGSDDLYEISEVQGRLHVHFLHKEGSNYSTHVFYVHSVTHDEVTFSSMGEREKITFQMFAIFLVDWNKLKLVRGWEKIKK